MKLKRKSIVVIFMLFVIYVFSFMNITNTFAQEHELKPVDPIIERSTTTVSPTGDVSRCCSGSGNGCVPYNC